ncbi:transposase zinc-binding domain-containing protein [Candidatus Enterovibrio escicola]|uniref:transposase zinc-binding domain-containing protein n=1 Tax=Candidatus Enterovibrio escicola TaxID=1927127 RepID=UPI001CC23A60
MSSHPCYVTDYHQSEIAKMLKCGSSENGFATYPCLSCGQGQHKVNFSCKGKACPQ